MILNDVRIIAGNSLVKQDVEIRHGRIHKIAKSLPKGNRCAGKLLLPGFANAHTHMASRIVTGLGIGLSKFEYFTKIGFKAHKIRTGDDVYNAALLAGIEFLKSGVTNVLTMDVHPKPVIKALEDLGLNYLAGYPLKDAFEEAQNIEKSFSMLERLNKKYKDRIYVGLANEIECTPKLMHKALEFAREHDMQIHMHACETRNEVKKIKRLTGKRTINYLKSLGFLDYDTSLAHCTYADTRDILLLSSHGVPVIHCPTSNYEIARNIPETKLMLKHDIIIGLGTDEFPWNPNPDVRNEALRAKNLGRLKIKDAFSMLWGGHALWEPTGIFEGAPANLLLIDLWKVKPYSEVNKLYMNMLRSNCISSVIINGEYKLKNYRLTDRIDERRIRLKVEQSRQKILDRIA